MMVDNVGAAGDSSSSNPMEARQEQPSKIDLWELLEPVDIVPKLPTNFWSSLEDSKWQLRKSALDSLNDLLVSNPKLADNAEHRQLVDKLTKVN
jgi:cytoskeleton-associated protein 5